jgi:hypothetical protein
MEQVITVGGKFHVVKLCGLILYTMTRKFLHSSVSHEFCDVVVKQVNYGFDIVVKPGMPVI